jgi:hypothetical protein
LLQGLTIGDVLAVSVQRLLTVSEQILISADNRAEV